MNGRGRQFVRGRGYNYHQSGDQHQQHQHQQHGGGGGGGGGGGSGGGGNSNHHNTGDRNGPIIKKIDDLSKSFQVQKTDIEEIKAFFSRYKSEHEEIKVLFSRMMTELDQIKTRLQELESTGGVKTISSSQQTTTAVKKFNPLKQRGKKPAKILNPEEEEQPPQAGAPPPPPPPSRFNNRRTNRNIDKRRIPREEVDKPAKPKNVNDDSTTQAAEPSSEDRPEGDDGKDGGAKERVKVFRRKKTNFNRRGQYSNRGRRADSSERNSNDTSPQGEANGNEKRKRNKKPFPKLSESELNAIVQTLKREFINSERPLKAIRDTIDAKGARVAYEFVISILDHAICDVTSPTRLSEIANNLFQLIVNEDNSYGVDFQQAFYSALNDIARREDDIAIDAPRYMDTLGQVLADCLVPMNGKHRYLIKKFLNGCISSYTQQNKATLLASIMKGVASTKDERFAKELFDVAQLNWNDLLHSNSVDLDTFLESHDVKFTTQTFAPEARKRDPKELEKFADDVTDLVEKRCTTQTLDDLVKDLNLDTEDRVDYLGTLIYAIVRGCLVTDAVNSYRLDSEALNKYSSILNAKPDDQDAIALYALTALTKLWHSYTSPRDLLRKIFMELHNHGTASYGALNEWLNSASLTNIPGIGAARLSSKRCIEDLGATLKA